MDELGAAPHERSVDTSLQPFCNVVPRNRPQERLRDRLLNVAVMGCMEDTGEVDHEKVVGALEAAVIKAKPSYKSVLEDAQMFRVLAAGLQRQGKDSVSVGIKRAVRDLLLAAVDAPCTSFSRSRVAERLGMHRKRARGMHSDTGPIPSSTAVSFKRQRKQHSNALGLQVENSIAEFAKCYCKYEEKTFVSLLTKEQVWKLYNQYHDRDGAFYPRGEQHAVGLLLASSDSGC